MRTIAKALIAAGFFCWVVFATGPLMAQGPYCYFDPQYNATVCIPNHIYYTYERHAALTWWFVMARIGQGLRQRYQVPNELPAKLLALIRKLEAIEGKSPRARTLIGTLDGIEGSYLKRYATSVEPRSVSASDDWPLCT